MSVVTSEQARKVLNVFAVMLENNLVTKDAVTWKLRDDEFADTNRLEYVEQRGPRYNTTETVGGVADLSAGVQSTVYGSERYLVDRTYGSSMGWGDFVKLRDVGEMRESEALGNAVTNMAEKIDFAVMNTAARASNNWVGTPANNINNLQDAMRATTRLMEEGVPKQDLRYLFAPIDRETLSVYLTTLAAPDALATGAVREGFTGMLDGVPTMFTQQLATITTGSRTNGAVNGASQNVNYRAVAVSPAQGQYMTQTISIDGVGANATIEAGAVFTIAGVFAWDNRKAAPVSPARLQQFTVVEAATATAGGAVAALRIFPAIIVPATGGDAQIQGENSAHGTVTAAPADNAVITFVGAASTAFTPRLLIQKQAIRVNTARLPTPSGVGLVARRQLRGVPISVRMWEWSEPRTGFHGVRFDTALTVNIHDRQRIIRLNGG